MIELVLDASLKSIPKPSSQYNNGYDSDAADTKAVLHRGTIAPNFQADDKHGLYAAFHFAFQFHRSVQLSVVDIQLMINQSIAIAVNKSPEQYRKLLVSHDTGVKTLEVERNEWAFLKVHECNWPEVCDEFATKIASKMPSTLANAMLKDFSVSDSNSRVAACVAVMNTTSAFYKYDVMSMCGIRSIFLDGSVEDWHQLRLRIDAMQLKQFGLQHYVPQLVQFVDQCVLLAQGKGNLDFWKSVYQFRSESGVNSFSGNIRMLSAFMTRNLDPYIFDSQTKTPMRDLPSGLGSASITWKQPAMSRVTELCMQAGFGQHADDGEVVKVTQGWRVIDPSVHVPTSDAMLKAMFAKMIAKDC
jgi:hypothetical protein